MQEFAVCIVLYAILFTFDVVPQIKSQKWKPLWFVFLVYIATFVLNALIIFDIIPRHLNMYLVEAIRFIFRIK